MPLRDKFVRVRPRTRAEIVGDEIAGLGFPPDLSDRLADWLLRAKCLPEDGRLREVVRHYCADIYDSWSKDSDPDILTMLIFKRLVSHEYGRELQRTYFDQPWLLDDGAPRRFATICAQEARFDFTDALRKVVAYLDTPAEWGSPGIEMAQVLWRYGLVEPERIVDPQLLLMIGKTTSIYGGSWSGDDDKKVRRNAREPAFWMAVDSAAAIRALGPAIAAASDEDLAWMARGINICAGRSHAVSGYPLPPPPLHVVTKWVFEVVDRRVSPDVRATHPLLRLTWMYLWRELWWRKMLDRDPVRDSRLLVAADLELGSLRPIVQQADEQAFKDRLPVIDVAASCMGELAPLWKGFQALLLAFRKLPVTGVASDLRWWSDTHHRHTPLPQPWVEIAMRLADHVHAFAKVEEEKDPELSELRTDFARFCLDRLKSREGGGPREDSDTWRLGYIDAVVALRINPDRKGHHTLHHAAENDPHSEVREAALKAYNVLRHNPKLQDGASPRRCVLLAFWHLRQAHLAALGVEMNERWVNRTREEEIRRTTEQEERDRKYRTLAVDSPPSEPQTGSSLP